jgi:hypothetical protein
MAALYRRLLLNGMYFDEIQEPKPEFRDQAK